MGLSFFIIFLPPHPGPAAVVGVFKADMGLTLLYGLIIAIPVAAFIALTWPRLPFIKKINPSIPDGLITNKTFKNEEMPSFGSSIFVALIPVVLMAIDAIATVFLPEGNGFKKVMDFVGQSNMALLIGLLISMWLLGPRIGRPLKDVMQSCSNAVKPM